MARFLSPFDRIQAIFSGSCSLVAVAAARLLRVRSLVHIAGGELVALPGIDYGGRRRRVSRLREALVLRTADAVTAARSEEHTSELQSLMRISYAVFCLKKKKKKCKKHIREHYTTYVLTHNTLM